MIFSLARRASFSSTRRISGAFHQQPVSGSVLVTAHQNNLHQIYIHSHTMVIVEEDSALEPPIQAKRTCPGCCFSYRVPTLRELYSRDKRLLRAILLIVILLNAPVGQYILYPFMLFSTWIHELFHGLAALSVGGSITW